MRKYKVLNYVILEGNFQKVPISLIYSEKVELIAIETEKY